MTLITSDGILNPPLVLEYSNWGKLLNAYDAVIKDSGDHFILVGSGALALHDMVPIDNITDLDVLVAPEVQSMIALLPTAEVIYSEKDSIIEKFEDRLDYRLPIDPLLHIDFQFKPFNTMTLWDETYESIKADSTMIQGYRVCSEYHALAMKFRTHPQREKDKEFLKAWLKRVTWEC